MSLNIDQFRYATYFAPRGKKRMQSLGNQVSQRYLLPTDKLIGVIGDAGSGKSLFIKGMFPGLELTNDDDGINTRPCPLMRDFGRSRFTAHSYHLDARFELAFHQVYELVEAIQAALKDNSRVIVEHFDALYDNLHQNANLLIGIGEEIIIARPTLFGPEPGELKNVVFRTIQYRRMAHTAEDCLVHVLEEEYHIKIDVHGDVKHGFILGFTKKPRVSLKQLEKKVRALLDQHLPVTYRDFEHIQIGPNITQHCTGPRTHVKNTDQVEHFRILDQWIYDENLKVYQLIGLVSKEVVHDIHKINQYAE
jgi:tRNA A37 threonylcarbamoyladenosine biosynthesis protein TsaE